MEHPESPSATLLPRVGKVVVLGGTGFIGAAVARRLLDHGTRVVVVARTITEADRTALAGARFVQGDATDPAVYAAELDDADGLVYTLAGLQPGLSNTDTARDLDDTMHPLLAVLELMAHRPAVHLVFLSSGGAVYGDVHALPVTEDHPTEPRSAYGILKLTAEKYIAMYSGLHGFGATILRIANVYGPGQRTGRGQGVVAEFIEAVRSGRPVRLFGSGSAVRDYIHVDDVAEAVEDALGQRVSRTLNIGTGTGTSTRELLDRVACAAGVAPVIEQVPARTTDVDAIVLADASFRKLTGRAPIGLDEGLVRTLRATEKGVPSV